MDENKDKAETPAAQAVTELQAPAQGVAEESLPAPESGSPPTENSYKSSPKDLLNPARYTPKTLKACELIHAGLEPKEALKAVNQREVTSWAVDRLKMKYKRWSLTRPSMVKTASKVMADVLKGIPREEAHNKVTSLGEVISYTDNVYPSHHDQVDVAKLVYAHVEPLVLDDPTRINNNIIQLDARTTERIAQLMIKRPACLPEPLVDLSVDVEPT